MNESVASPINLFIKTTQDQGPTLFESGIKALSNGVKCHSLSPNSELAPIVSQSDQIAQTTLEELSVSFKDEDKSENEIQATLWPPAITQESVDEIADDDLFGEKEINNFIGEDKKIDIQQESDIEKKETIAESQHYTNEIQEVAIQKSDSLKKVNTNPAKERSIRNRIISAEKLDRIQLTFGGDLALAFESKKAGHLVKIRELAVEYIKCSSETHVRQGLKSIDSEDIELAALRAHALKANARGNIDFTEEDAGKISDKATDLLRPDMKDTEGNPITDEKFDLIKDEIKKDFQRHLISLGMVTPTDSETTEVENSTKKSLILEKNISPLQSKDQKTRGKSIQSEGALASIKMGFGNIAEDLIKLNIARAEAERNEQNKLDEAHDKKMTIDKKELGKSIIKDEIKQDEIAREELESKEFKEEILETEADKLTKEKITVKNGTDSLPEDIFVVDPTKRSHAG